jgi:hypothetical protein
MVNRFQVFGQKLVKLVFLFCFMQEFYRFPRYSFFLTRDVLESLKINEKIFGFYLIKKKKEKICGQGLFLI